MPKKSAAVTTFFIVILSATLAFGADAGRQPNGFKFNNGFLLEWEASTKALETGAPRESYGHVQARPVGCIGKFQCVVRTMPHPYSDGIFRFESDRFFDVTAPVYPVWFDDISAALIESLGPPDNRRSEVVENLMGAKFDNVVLEWSFPDVRVEFHKLFGSVDNGALRMTYLPIARTVKKEKLRAPF